MGVATDTSTYNSQRPGAHYLGFVLLVSFYFIPWDSSPFRRMFLELFPSNAQANPRCYFRILKHIPEI